MSLNRTEVGFTDEQLESLKEQGGQWGISRAAANRVILDHWLGWRDDPDGVDLPDKLRQPRKRPEKAP